MTDELVLLVQISIPNLSQMARDSRLLEWCSILEDQCFVNHLLQAVSMFLIQFYLIKF